MDRGPLQKAILLYLTWLGVIGGALIVMLGDLLPLSLSFVRADSLFTCFLQSQIFFVVFLWPLFLPVLIRGGESGTGLLVSKNTNELKTRVSRGVSDRRVYACFAKGS